MIDDLEFLKGEIKKVQKTLKDTNPNSYKKYATLLQAYLTETNTANQMIAIIKQRKEQEERERQNQEAAKKAEKELKKEEKAAKKSK